MIPKICNCCGHKKDSYTRGRIKIEEQFHIIIICSSCASDISKSLIKTEPVKERYSDKEEQWSTATDES